LNSAGEIEGESTAGEDPLAKFSSVFSEPTHEQVIEFT